MKQLTAPVLLLLLASCSATRSGAAPYAAQDSPAAVSSVHRDRANRVALYYGVRSFDEEEYFDPVEEQATFGVEYSREPAGSLIGWELGIQGSVDEDFDSVPVQGTTGELYGGLRKTFGSGAVQPYIGGGLSLIHVDFDVIGSGADDFSAAGYGHAGVLFGVAPGFFLGLDLRVLFGSELSFFGTDTDADYGQLALLLGWSF